MGSPILLDIVEGIGLIAGGGLLQLKDGAIDQGGTQIRCPIAHKAIEDFAAAHPDVLVLLKGMANIHLDIGGGNHFHFAHTAVNDFRW